MARDRVKLKKLIHDIRFHDLRHEAISRFFEMGLSVPEVAMMSGHRTVSQLFHYAHVDVSHLLNKMNNREFQAVLVCDGIGHLDSDLMRQLPRGKYRI